MKNWLDKKKTQTPIPASQLPNKADKTYNVPDVIDKAVRDSKPVPEAKPSTKIKFINEETEADRLKKKFKNKSLKKGGGIYIKPENKGKFTATKKKTGKSTEELTHSKNPLTRKRAIFAQNSAKWSHKGKK